MPNPRYKEKAIDSTRGDLTHGETSQRSGEKSPNKSGKIGPESKRFYQQPNRFGMDKKKKKMKGLGFPENPHKSSHVVPVRFG